MDLSSKFTEWEDLNNAICDRLKSREDIGKRLTIGKEEGKKKETKIDCEGKTRLR